MTQRIIYQNDEGGVCIVVPASEFLLERTIEEYAVMQNKIDAAQNPEDLKTILGV